MVEIGKQAGKKMLALITDMDRPLGDAIGNTLEVKEAIDTLNGHGPEDFTEICVILATNMLYLAGKGSLEECETLSKAHLKTAARSKRSRRWSKRRAATSSA